MKRRISVFVLIGVVAIALSLVTFFSLRPPGQASGSVPKPPTLSANAPRRTGTPPPWAPKGPTAPGSPAITPHLTGVTPTYTAADVRAFYAAHEPSQTAQGPKIPRTIVTKVACMTSAAAVAITHQGLQMPRVTHVCIATLRGLFQIDTPPALPPAFGSTAYDVFDAQTGNMVAEFIHYSATSAQQVLDQLKATK